MRPFDWHGDPITRDTPVTGSYKNTQNVRRFLKSQCGERFKFDRAFMRWIKDGTEKTMGEVADEWRRRQAGNSRFWLPQGSIPRQRRRGVCPGGGKINRV